MKTFDKLFGFRYHGMARIVRHAFDNPVPRWWKKLLMVVAPDTVLAVSLVRIFEAEHPELVRRNPGAKNEYHITGLKEWLDEFVASVQRGEDGDARARIARAFAKHRRRHNRPPHQFV